MADVREWYSAKTVYLVTSNTVKLPTKLYEERIIVLKTESFDEAIQEAEREALLYADEGSGVKYLGYINVFKLSDEKVKNKTEVFSLMRESNLGAEKYIDRYFDTGNEKTKHL